MATKARKLTLSIVLASHRIKTLRSLNEVTCEACFVSDCMNCSSCRITLDNFFNGALNEMKRELKKKGVAALGGGLDYYYYYFSFLSSFLPRNYFLYFSFFLAMIG